MTPFITTWIQSGPIIKNRVLPVTTIFFENFVSVEEPLINSSFDVPVAQTPKSVLFVRAGVLFDGAFSLWVSLKEMFNPVMGKILHIHTQIFVNFWNCFVLSDSICH